MIVIRNFKIVGIFGCEHILTRDVKNGQPVITLLDRRRNEPKFVVNGCFGTNNPDATARIILYHIYGKEPVPADVEKMANMIRELAA